jgi:hydroxyethylthiazole kinase-like uncharacterized protein yjeF
MENAGAGAARIALEMLATVPGGEAVCLCGPGGNGGDAMVVARHLSIAGVRVRLARIGGSPGGDSGLQASICTAMGLVIAQIYDERDVGELLGARSPVALLVDGLYGTGLTRPLSGVASSLVRAMNACGSRVLALDIPSGLDCDTGVPLGPCVRADVTATFGGPKLGFSNSESLAWTGDVRIVSIGAPLEPRPT